MATRDVYLSQEEIDEIRVAMLRRVEALKEETERVRVHGSLARSQYILDVLSRRVRGVIIQRD